MENMPFPATPAEFIEQYSFKDKKEVYTNGAELISVFRVEQMIDHYYIQPEQEFLNKTETEVQAMAAHRDALQKQNDVLRGQLAMVAELRTAEKVAPTRPCKVDGELCRFHRFVEQDRLIMQVNSFARPDERENITRRALDTGIIPGGLNATAVIRETRALIEWPAGQLSTVAIERVQFTDGMED